MKYFKIILSYDCIIKANDKREAKQDFWNNHVYDVQQLEGDFIDSNLQIREASKEEVEEEYEEVGETPPMAIMSLSKDELKKGRC